MTEQEINRIIAQVIAEVPYRRDISRDDWQRAEDYARRVAYESSRRCLLVAVKEVEKLIKGTKI